MDRAQSRQGFERAVLELRPRVQRAALKLTRGAISEADDLVQDTLERGLLAYETFEPGTNLASWLVTILHRLFIDHIRHRRRYVHEQFGKRDLPSPEPALPEAPWEKLSSDEIWRAVEELPEDLKRVFELHERQGRTYEDIASLLGVPRNTVGTRLYRARRVLRDRLSRELDVQGQRKP